MMFAETHMHVCDSQFSSDRDQVISRARSSGVDLLIEIADGPTHWEDARALATQYAPNVWWTCGFHPHYAEESVSFDFSKMSDAARDQRCVAVGEIGLDYFKSTADRKVQESLFRKTLDIAAHLNLPVVIHSRQASADTLRILKSFYAGSTNQHISPGVIHCFSGDIHFAMGCLELGFFLGVDGPITYPSAQPLRDVISQIPLDRLVLETDCPYLPPQGFRGLRNEPSYLVRIAEKVAELHHLSLDEVAQQTSRNAKILYRLNPKIK